MINFKHHNWIGSLLHFLIGGLLAVVAWGEYSSPAVSLVLPLIWALTPTRAAAFSLSFGYQLGVVRFLPPFAGVWFDSFTLGLLAWVGQGLLAASTWALLWPRRKSSVLVGAMTALVLVASMVLPWAAVVQSGHPLVSLGYLFPGMSWFGVLLFFTLIPVIAERLTVLIASEPLTKLPNRTLAYVLVGTIALACGSVGDKLNSSEKGRGRAAGRIGAIHTEWGQFPQNDAEAVSRIEKMGKVVRTLAGGEDGFDTIVFPEAIIGMYEPGTSAVIDHEVLKDAQTAGQTVVIGADINIGTGKYQSAAIVFRPDRSTSFIAARQTPPIAAWAPWRTSYHFPADWFGISTTNVGRGIRARFMFCFEEYMPILHLISEATEEHQLIISMSNGWASRNPLSSAIQSGHTEGMAKLFGKTWIRSENRALPLGQP